MPPRYSSPSYLDNWRWVYVFVFLSVLSLIANRIIPAIVNPYYLQIAMYVGINTMMAVSLNLVTGIAGQFSLGHAGFMAVGAYVSAYFTYYHGRHWVDAMSTHLLGWNQLFHDIPFLGSLLGTSDVSHVFPQALIFSFAIAISGLSAALCGFIVGLPILRLRGDYLAIATLGFGEIIRVLILNNEAVGGARGFTNIPGYTNVFWLGLCSACTMRVIYNLIYSTKGLAFKAIREDEIAAEAMGVDTVKYKVGAFVIGAFFAGVAGCLLAHQVGYLHTNSFTFLRSIEIVVMVVLGGMGRIWGVAAAAAVLTLLPEILRVFSEFRMVIYSLILIILMILRARKWTPRKA